MHTHTHTFVIFKKIKHKIDTFIIYISSYYKNRLLLTDCVWVRVRALHSVQIYVVLLLDKYTYEYESENKIDR